VNPEQCSRRSNGVWVCDECGYAYELPPSEVAERLSAGPARVRQATEAVSARLDVAPRPGIWTPRQYLAHLTDWAEIIADRLTRIAREDRPLLESYDQDALAIERSYNRWDVPSTLDRFEAATLRSLTLIGSDGPESWDRVGVRDDLGELAFGLYANDLVHELEHHLLDVTDGPVNREKASARGETP
jgi:hypothetical protein